MHEEIEHMKVGTLRKMVSAKRKIACPPVSKLPKAGLLGELAAYEAEGKARDAAKEHGPVTMKGKAKKEIVVRVKKVRMTKEEREAKMAAAKAEKEAAKETRKAESAASYARYLEGQAKQKEASKEEKANARAAAKEAKKAEKVAEKAVKVSEKAQAKVDTIQHVVDGPVSKVPKKGKKAAAKVPDIGDFMAQGAAKAPKKGKVAAAAAAIEEKIEKKKRPLTAYQEYIKANVGKGKMTMTEAAAAYQAQK